MTVDLNVMKTALTEHQSAVQKMIDEGKAANEAQTAALRKEIEDVKKALVSVEENIKSRQTQLFNDPKDVKKFSISKLVTGMALQKAGSYDPWSRADAGYEYEACKAYREQIAKTALAGDSANLGYLIPNQLSEELIKNVWADLPLKTMDVTFYDNLVGDFYINKEANKFSTYWLGENQAPAQSDMSIGQIKMSPKKIGAYAKFSRMLQQQTSGNADRVIMENLQNALADGMHDAFINGSGIAGQPRGIVNFASLNDRSSATNGQRLNASMLASDLWYLRSLNEIKDSSRLGALMNPLVLGFLMDERVQQFSGQGVGLGQMSLGIEALIDPAILERNLGLALRSTSQLTNDKTRGTSTTCSYAIIGDFSKICIGTWRDIELRVSDQIAMTTDEIVVVAFSCVDIACKRESALAIRKDCETNKDNFSY